MDKMKLIQKRISAKEWAVLLTAVLAEVVATSLLKSTEGFTRLWPSVMVAVSYEIAFLLLMLSLRTIPLGIVYSVWSGLGVSLVALMGWCFLGQAIDGAGLIGITLILGGVLLINGSSKSESGDDPPHPQG